MSLNKEQDSVNSSLAFAQKIIEFYNFYTKLQGLSNQAAWEEIKRLIISKDI